MKRYITILILGLLATTMAQGQIKIGGSVYGGGNHGNVDGSANVRVCAGDINKVFGGARMANIGGNTYVHIDGAHATGYSVINYVYGGNDVAGKIGTIDSLNRKNPSDEQKTLPTEIAGNTDGVDLTWNSYVHLSTKVDEEGHAADDAKKCFIGQMFAGGNGDFTYTDDEGNPLMVGEQYVAKEGDDIIAYSETELSKPELDKTYLDIQGGTIFFAHGGGNNATVREKAVIHVANPSEVVTDIKVNAETGLEDNESGTDILTDDRIYPDRPSVWW